MVRNAGKCVQIGSSTECGIRALGQVKRQGHDAAQARSLFLAEAGVLVQTMLAAAEHAYDYWLRRPPGQTLHQLTRRALDIAAGSGSPA